MAKQKRCARNQTKTAANLSCIPLGDWALESRRRGRTGGGGGGAEEKKQLLCRLALSNPKSYVYAYAFIGQRQTSANAKAIYPECTE